MSFGAGLVRCESSTVERQQAVRFAEWLSGHIINCFLFSKKGKKIVRWALSDNEKNRKSSFVKLASITTSCKQKKWREVIWLWGCHHYRSLTSKQFARLSAHRFLAPGSWSVFTVTASFSPRYFFFLFRHLHRLVSAHLSRGCSISQLVKWLSLMLTFV